MTANAWINISQKCTKFELSDINNNKLKVRIRKKKLFIKPRNRAKSFFFKYPKLSKISYFHSFFIHFLSFSFMFIHFQYNNVWIENMNGNVWIVKMYENVWKFMKMKVSSLLYPWNKFSYQDRTDRTEVVKTDFWRIQHFFFLNITIY